METLLKACTLRTAVSLIYFSALCWSARAAAPANDNFANAELITILQGSVTGSNIDATREPGKPDHAGNQGGASIWWKITAPESGYLTLSTFHSPPGDGQGVDTLLAVYTGTELSNLALKDANDTDAETWSWTSKLVLSVTGGVQYYIAVDGWTDGSIPPDQGEIVLDVIFSKTPSYRAAPAWQLPDLQGSMVRSSDFTNQVVVLNIWATWCPPCVEEIPRLIALQEKYRNLGLAVVGVSADEAKANAPPIALVGGFAQEHGINYPIVMAQPGGLSVENGL